MKKNGWLSLVLVLFFLAAWGGPGPVQAGESDTLLLLNLLKKKGVITEQEAQDLMKEVQVQAKQEKEERKAEIKEVAQKGDFLPGYLKGVKFGTTIFAQWLMKSEDKGGATTNEFQLNRGYLTLSGKLNSWLGFNLTSDIFTSKDADDKGNGLEIRMKYAYADLYFWNTVTEMGLAHTPSDMYDSYVWPYRVQGKHFLDDNSIQSSADYGADIRGTFGGTMDEEFTKYAGSTYAGKWGGYQLGIYNGGGYTNPEANTNKPVGGLVYFRPAPGVDLLKGLVLSYFGMFGQSNNTFTAKGKTNDYPNTQVNLAQMAWQHKWFTLFGQYYWGKGTFTSTEDNSRSGWLAEGFVRIPKVEKLRVFGRYFNYDPNTDLSNNAQNTYVLGVSYDWSKEFMPFMAYEHRDFENPNSKDYDQFQLGFQLKF
jgi:hypothetical protein